MELMRKLEILGAAAKAAKQFPFSVLAGNRICHFLPPGLMIHDDLIDQAVILGLLRGHIVVAVGIPLHNFQRLAGVFAEHTVHLFLDGHNMIGMNLDVGSLPGKSAVLAAGNQRLVNEDLRIGQRKPLALSAAGQQERAHGGSHAHADGGDIALDVFHRVVDGHTVRDGAARAVDVEADVLFGVLTLKEQKLCNNKACRSIIYLFRKKNYSILQKS